MSWENVRLGDVCNVIAGYAFKSELFKNEGIPLLRISNIVEGEISFKEECVRVEDSKSSSLSKFKVQKNDILVALSGATTGKFGVYKLDQVAFLNQRVGLIRATKKLDQRYFYHYLNILKKEIMHTAQGAAQPNISTNEIIDFQIPLPPLPIQKRIAEILDAADALKRKDQELLKKYDELAQAIFINMFGEPVKNEKGWEVKTICEFGEISTGNTPPRADVENYDSKYIEWIKTDNIDEDMLFVTNSSEYLSKKGAKRGRITPSGSLLVACIAGGIESIGRAALTDREVSFNQQINSIEPNSNVKSLFLYFLFKYSRKHIQNQASNGMKRMLSKGEFEKIKMILPDLNVQQEFENKIGQLIIQKEQMRHTFFNSQNLFNSLIQKAFKGELVA